MSKREFLKLVGGAGLLAANAFASASPGLANATKQNPEVRNKMYFPPVAKHQSFANLIAPDAVLEQVVTGFGFTEGVTWVRSENQGLFWSIPKYKRIREMTDG
jgi:hypothetical protein